MRILHTGDWHMNDRLGQARIPRGGDILRSLEQIAHYLQSESVDVMVVAGDLFCDKSSKEDLRGAVSEIERIFRSFLAGGGTIVAISGNHDNATFFHTLRDTLKLAPHSGGGGGRSFSFGACVPVSDTGQRTFSGSHRAGSSICMYAVSDCKPV